MQSIKTPIDPGLNKMESPPKDKDKNSVMKSHLFPSNYFFLPLINHNLLKY